MRYVTVFSVMLALFVPLFVFAQGLVPDCAPSGGSYECNACHLVTLAQNILNFLIVIAIPIAAILFAVAGFRLMSAGGNEQQLQSAKNLFANVLIGFIIILAAWLIIDTIMKTFLPDGQIQGFGPWNQIQCVGGGGTAPGGAGGTGSGGSGGTGSGGAGGTGSGGAAACTNCVPLSGTGIPLKSSNACANQATDGCSINDSTAQKLTQLDSNLAGTVNWQVTEAYPPTVNHSNPCHTAGTCVDANCIGGCNASEINTFITAAESAGLNPVYEVQTTAERDQLVDQGVPSNNIQVVSAITAPHFSVYNPSA